MKRPIDSDYRDVPTGTFAYLEELEKYCTYIESLNPMKIDEERLNKWNISKYGEPFHPLSDMKKAVDYYNSTLEDHQVLQPLPSEIPKELRDKYIKDNSYFLKDMWQELIKHYGTPTKKELVSVEKLGRELMDIDFTKSNKNHYNTISQHIIDTYSLNAPKREWWMDCEKFMYKGRVYKKYSYEIFPDGHTVLHAELSRHDIKDCTPYIEPSLHDKVKEKLGSDLYEEFMKEVKGA